MDHASRPSDMNPSSILHCKQRGENLTIWIEAEETDSFSPSVEFCATGSLSIHTRKVLEELFFCMESSDKNYRSFEKGKFRLFREISDPDMVITILSNKPVEIALTEQEDRVRNILKELLWAMQKDEQNIL